MFAAVIKRITRCFLIFRFMESEIELHEAIQELHALATVPDLYPLLVQLQAIPSLLDLLSHENTDISVAVVDLLQVKLC